jgi:ubiquinone/menaquinone biosynthesis C-methylase UbiE
MSETHLVPNHHAHYGGFAGISGLVAALSMVRGRDGDARSAAQLSALVPDDVLLDIGCGPGGSVRHAARVGATVTGVDPAPVMLRTARVLTRPRRNVRFVKGVAESLPVADGAATVVWAIATVHHWPDLDTALDEVRRALAPGGRFVAIERQTISGAHGLASHGWTDEQAAAFADLCREHGFDNPRVDHNTSGRRNTVSVTATRP